MDIEEIKTLTGLMIDNDLSEIMIRDGEKRIFLRRGAAPNSHPQMHHPMPPPMMAVHAHPPAAPSAASPAPASAADPGLQPIASPMVGTFYSAANPESPPFVKIGDKVSPETVVCIIEAMKVMNEIKSEVEGEVLAVLAQSGEAVEFDQPLFLVKPAGAPA